MSKLEIINMLIKLLDIPEGQKWVSIEQLQETAEKIDDNQG